MKSIRGLLLALALLIFGVLAVAACGGDDDDTSDSGDEGGAQTSAPADDGDSGDDEEQTDAPADDEEDPTDAPADDGGDDGGSDGGDFDASEVCNILSKEDVEGAFGVSMLDPEYIPLPDVGSATVGSCSYVGAESSESYSVTLYAANDQSMEALFDGACSGKDSAGVGDDSCWYSEAHTEIQMLSGSNFVDMFVTTVDGDAEAISTTLADRIHGQIGG